MLAAGTTLAAAQTPADSPGVPVAPVPPGADLRAATVKVVVAPDHRDWTYKLGEPARFAVSVTADSEPIDSATVTYSVGPDMFPGEKKTAALPKGLKLSKGGKLSGTVASTVRAGNYSIKVQVTDSTTPTAKTATATLTLTVT